MCKNTVNIFSINRLFYMFRILNNFPLLIKYTSMKYDVSVIFRQKIKMTKLFDFRHSLKLQLLY